MSDKQMHTQSVLGRNLTILRKACKLTQAQVADILKIKRSTYAYYERDITPTVENIKKLSTLFDVSVHFLLYGVEEKDPFEFNKALTDSVAEEVEKTKLKDLSKDEALLMSYYRLVSSQTKAKIIKEVQELYEKSN